MISEADEVALIANALQIETNRAYGIVFDLRQCYGSVRAAIRAFTREGGNTVFKSRAQGRALIAMAALGQMAFGPWQESVRYCSTPKDVVDVASFFYVGLPDVEILTALFFSASDRYLAGEQIASGGRSGCAFEPKEVARRALHMGASSVALVHNHPSGTARLGEDDIAAAQSVEKCLSLGDIALKDFIVITEDDWASWRVWCHENEAGE